MNILELKSKHGIIIKYPILLDNNTNTFYFRRMTLGEYISYANNISDAGVLSTLLQKMLIQTEGELTLEEVIDIQPGLALSLCQSIASSSDFQNEEKFYKLYEQAVHFSLTSMATVMQHILAAYPGYKLSDLMDMNSDDFMVLAAFAEQKMAVPGVVEYSLFSSYLKAQYIKQNNLNPDEVDYSYDLYIKDKMGDSSEENSNAETFVTETGRVVRGDRQEYLRRKAYEREQLRRRSAGLPPVSAARFFKEFDGEGLDPTTIAQQTQSQPDDVASIAAQNAKRDLQKQLDRDKQLGLSGVKKSNVFNWQNDVEPNL